MVQVRHQDSTQSESQSGVEGVPVGDYSHHSHDAWEVGLLGSLLVG